MRRIAHVDMDAFFASCELQRYPQLKGLPVVIGGGRHQEERLLQELAERYPDRSWSTDCLHEIPVEFFRRLRHYKGRGVITTATYAARQFGVGSAMGLMKAAALCPDAILLPGDFNRYRQFSQAFKAVITSIAPDMEDRGIDEVYVDLTAAAQADQDDGRATALRLQQGILQATGLSCSVGVAPNKLLAKLASEFQKPAGITVLESTDLAERIWPLPCRKLNGIGPKSDAKLQALGITTLGALAQTPAEHLVAQFGRSYGLWLHAAAWGRDDRPISNRSEPVSISRETTFERDLHPKHDRSVLGDILTRLAEQLANDLQRKGYVAKTIGIKVRYDNFEHVTRDLTLAAAIRHAPEVRRTAGLCLKRIDLSRRLRLLGLRASHLSPLAESANSDDSSDQAPGQQLRLDFGDEA